MRFFYMALIIVNQMEYNFHLIKYETASTSFLFKQSELLYLNVLFFKRLKQFSNFIRRTGFQY